MVRNPFTAEPIRSSRKFVFSEPYVWAPRTHLNEYGHSQSLSKLWKPYKYCGIWKPYKYCGNWWNRHELGFLVSKIISFLVSKFQGFTKFQFHIFWKMLAPYPSFSKFYYTDRRDLSTPNLFENWQTGGFPKLGDVEHYMFKTVPAFLDLFRYPGASEDKSYWFCGSGTHPKIPKS